jgi:GT2 family glycosyltransferase
MGPFVSVIILTMGEPKRVLDCLKAQTYQNFEVIIASEKGIVNAMNKALERAKGEIFVRIDDDVEMPSRWLERLIEPFRDPIVGGVTGPTYVPIGRRENRDSIRIANNPNWFLRWMFDNRSFAPAAIYKCGSVSYDSNYMEKFMNQETGYTFEADHLEGTNWAMRTHLIRLVGGFDMAFDGVAEWFDTDVEQKIKKLGNKLRYNPSAYLYHLLEKSENFYERQEIFGRIENWLRFHRRHSKFHYKKIIWLTMMIGYSLCPRR